MCDILNDLGYVDITDSDINLFIGAIALFKNAVCTILVSDNKVYISSELDYSNHYGFEKYSYIVTKGGLIPWKTAK